MFIICGMLGFFNAFMYGLVLKSFFVWFGYVLVGVIVNILGTCGINELIIDLRYITQEK